MQPKHAPLCYSRTMAVLTLVEPHLMKTAPLLLIRLLTTTVTLGFLWLVIKQGRVLEMATALLVLLIDYLQLVNVSV